MNPKKHRLLLIYQIAVAILALISIILLLCSYSHAIDINQPPYLWIDRGIWLVLVIDYFTRLTIAQNKLKFIRENIWDLLSIIPVNALFSIFRFARIARVFPLLRFLRLIRLVGLAGRFRRFFHTDGLIYYLYLSCGILFIAAGIYSVSEGVSFSTAFWWAMATVSTVGYGDIAPTTLWGRIAAILLMVVGVSIIGLLTSTITKYFDSSTSTKESLKKEIQQLHAENWELHRQITEIEKLLKEIQAQNDKHQQ